MIHVFMSLYILNGDDYICLSYDLYIYLFTSDFIEQLKKHDTIFQDKNDSILTELCAWFWLFLFGRSIILTTSLIYLCLDLNMPEFNKTLSYIHVW